VRVEEDEAVTLHSFDANHLRTDVCTIPQQDIETLSSMPLDDEGEASFPAVDDSYSYSEGRIIRYRQRIQLYTDSFVADEQKSAGYELKADDGTVLASVAVGARHFGLYQVEYYLSVNGRYSVIPNGIHSIQTELIILADGSVNVRAWIDDTDANTAKQRAGEVTVTIPAQMGRRPAVNTIGWTISGAITAEDEPFGDLVVELVTDESAIESTSYFYDNQHRLTRVVDHNNSSHWFHYDATMHWLNYVEHPDATQTTFGYDVVGRLKTIELPDGGRVVNQYIGTSWKRSSQLYYDASGAKQREEDYRWWGQSIHEKRQRERLDDLDPITQLPLWTDDVITKYGWYGSKPLWRGQTRVAGDGSIVTDPEGNAVVATHDYVRDHGGNVTALVGPLESAGNPNGLYEKYSYDVWGTLDRAMRLGVNQSGEDTSVNIKQETGPRYRGYWSDALNIDVLGSFYHTQNREYLTGIGQFAQEDPARAGTNWYAYADGDPVNRWDPSGLDWVWNGSEYAWDGNWGDDRSGGVGIDTMHPIVQKQPPSWVHDRLGMDTIGKNYYDQNGSYNVFLVSRQFSGGGLREWSINWDSFKERKIAHGYLLLEAKVPWANTRTTFSWHPNDWPRGDVTAQIGRAHV